MDRRDDSQPPANAGRERDRVPALLAMLARLGVGAFGRCDPAPLVFAGLRRRTARSASLLLLAVGVGPARFLSLGRDRPLEVVRGLPIAPTPQGSQLREPD
jgi:hypothetical protein